MKNYKFAVFMYTQRYIQKEIIKKIRMTKRICLDSFTYTEISFLIILVDSYTYSDLRHPNSHVRNLRKEYLKIQVNHEYIRIRIIINEVI